MRARIRATIAGLLLALAAPFAVAQVSELRVEIHEPAPNLLLTRGETSIQVEGGASIFGGVRYLDLFLVLDSSTSLEKNDRDDHRTAGAIGLVRSLPAKSDIQIGVVDFDGEARLVAPLTTDREAVIGALSKLDRFGKTDIAAGIRTALDGFVARARPDSSRVLLLFTDGKSSESKARAATAIAKSQGVAIHTLLLGRSGKGEKILREIAETTGGAFLRVTDPKELPEAFLSLRTTGVERVTLRVGDGQPVEAKLSGGSFSGRVPLQIGENRIVAAATSLAGETREAALIVMVSGTLAVMIDAPVDGTVLTERESEVAVEGTASAFQGFSPEALAAHPDRGVRQVLLSVNGSPPFATTLADGRFQGRVLLQEGVNRIVATAASTDGRSAQNAVNVEVRAQGCGELEVAALRDGETALSLSDRSIEFVFDASNSMWGRMEGRPKISVAKGILEDALDWLPDDLQLGLRVYGHQHAREQKNCTDSELLAPVDIGNRMQIRDAIASFRPRGQTPLAYSLRAIATDLREVPGERAVVLVTDGIESCGGDPVAAARALQRHGRIPVHVIGFGLGRAVDQDQRSLRAIADATGGRYFAAHTADELREALTDTVGTPFSVLQGRHAVASGTLGSRDRFALPPGEYVVRLDTEPPREVAVRVAGEERVTLVLERLRGRVTRSEDRTPTAYFACETAPTRPGRRHVPARIR